MNFSIEQVTEDSGFIRLQDEWNALLQQSRNNEITLTWEWLYIWWKVFKTSERRLMILAVRDSNGKLVGIAPLQVREVRHNLLLPKIKRIEFLASGEDVVDEICSEYLNFIILHGLEHEVILRLIDYLTNDLAFEWDEIIFDNILGSSENVQQFERALGENYPLRYEKERKGPCFYIPLPKTWNEFLNGLGNGLQRAYRYDLKRLSSKGKMTYVKVNDPNELEWGLKVLVDLHQQRWAAKGKNGAFSSERFLSFHRQIMPLALRNGWLQLRVLQINETPLAAIYNFKYNGKIYFYQSGIDSNTYKTISIGMLVIGSSIEEGISEGMTEFDFLLGDSDYKRRWTKTSRDLEVIRVMSLKKKMKVLLPIADTANFLKRVMARL